MRFLSLFAGIGGFDLGLERAGMTCVGQVENDPYCIKVLEKHWPHVKRIPDIKDITGDEFGPVNLVCGGFPCQPWSAAGKRRGTEDDRDLWPEMLRVIEAVRPRWVIGENVRNFVSMEMGLDRSISDLEAIGYAVEAFLLGAVSVDAPHRRDRCWVVANAQRERGPGGVLHTGDKLQTRPGGAADTPGAGGEGQPTLADPADPNDQTCSSERGRASLQFGRSGSRVTLADTDGSGRQQQRGAKPARAELPAVERGGDGTAQWWLPEPDLGLLVDGLSTGLAGWPGEPEGVPRVATGVQDRVSKLRALGNSVVPQIPEIIGRAILEAEGG